ncbi:MAG: hypothetical protein R3B72_30800 [Polyangiaceae bacterium]
MPIDRRRRLIGELATTVRKGDMSPEAREAALTLIGRLARRAPHEPPDTTPMFRR